LSDDNHLDASPESSGGPAGRRLGAALRQEAFEVLKTMGLFLVLFWALKTFVVEGYEVQGPSMLPTLSEQERILVFKLPQEIAGLVPVLGLRVAKPDDIIVFRSTDEVGKRYVKRVIAAAPARTQNTASASAEAEVPALGVGDVVVEIREGCVYVDDSPVAEDSPSAEKLNPRESHPPVVLHPGEFYVMGDHRSVSRDSRSFGAVDAEQVVGRAVFRFWPLHRAGLL